MQITFQPVRDDRKLTLARMGDTLVINGEAFDFARLADGAALPASAIAGPWFAGPVRRIGGVLHLSLILPHGAQAPQARLYPTPVAVDRDGPVDLPPETCVEDAE